MRLKTLSLPTLLFALLATSAAHAAPKTPCDLLSHQAAETLFGAPLAKALPSNGLACVYYNNPDSSVVNIHFLVLPDGAPPTFGPTLLKTSLHKDYDTDVVTNIPGLGEDNHCITSKQISKETISVLYHKSLITLSVTGSKNPNRHAAMIQTMKQALAQF